MNVITKFLEGPIRLLSNEKPTPPARAKYASVYLDGNRLEGIYAATENKHYAEHLCAQGNKLEFPSGIVERNTFLKQGMFDAWRRVYSGLGLAVNEYNLPVYTHTVNSKLELKGLRALGVDGIYTDDLGR